MTRIDCFFFNDTATTEIYTLSLHDALPISYGSLTSGSYEAYRAGGFVYAGLLFSSALFGTAALHPSMSPLDRKSTRLNSSHANISYAVFCLKKTTPHYSATRSRRPRPCRTP